MNKMLGFLIFAILIMALAMFNMPRSEANAGICNDARIPAHNMYTTSDPTLSKHQIARQQFRRAQFVSRNAANGDIDALTKENTEINSTTAVTSTKVEPLLKGAPTDLVRNIVPKKKKVKKASGRKLKFSNNVKVRLFDKATRDVIDKDKMTKLALNHPQQ